MADANFQLPTSQVAAQMTASSDPVSTIRTSQTAEVAVFPKSGINTLVRVLYASIDPIDYKFPSMPWPIPRLAVGPSPLIPGATFVGRVWKTTNPDLKPGDTVWGKCGTPQRLGACAEYVLVTGDQSIVKIPDNWSSTKRGVEEFAAAGVVALTAFQSLNNGTLPYTTSNGKARGGTVFINGGSGGVGTFGVQIAKNCFGCDKVVVSCSGANAELVKNLGADEVVDYRNCGDRGIVGWLKDWSKRNGGQKFDHIADYVGSDSDMYWQCHHFLSEKGGYVQVGGGLDFGALAGTAKKMLWPAALGGGKRPFQFLALAEKKEHFELLGQWFLEGKIKTVIEDENRFDLADVLKAYKKLSTGRTRGKMIIKIGADHV